MQKRRIYGLFVLVCVIFGNTFLAISLGLKEGASPLFFAALRFTLAGSVMLLSLIFFKRITIKGILPLIGRSVFLSLFLTYANFGCMFIAQTKVDSGLMARLDATTPIITALFATLMLGKKLSVIHIGAFILGTTGLFFIASPATKNDPVFLLAAAGSVLFYAFGNSLFPLLFRNGEDPVVISALQSFTGGLLLTVTAIITESIRFPLSAVGPLLYLTLGGSIVAQTATLVMVREAGPVFASGWLYVAPVIATISGAIVLGESVSAGGIIGMILALVGVLLLDHAERRQKTAVFD